jgi:hypothetical protein
MAALRFGLKCSRTSVYAPLLNLIDALPLNVTDSFETASKNIYHRVGRGQTINLVGHGLRVSGYEFHNGRRYKADGGRREAND